MKIEKRKKKVGRLHMRCEIKRRINGESKFWSEHVEEIAPYSNNVVWWGEAVLAREGEIE